MRVRLRPRSRSLGSLSGCRHRHVKRLQHPRSGSFVLSMYQVSSSRDLKPGDTSLRLRDTAPVGEYSGGDISVLLSSGSRPGHPVSRWHRERRTAGILRRSRGFAKCVCVTNSNHDNESIPPHPEAFECEESRILALLEGGSAIEAIITMLDHRRFRTEICGAQAGHDSWTTIYSGCMG